MVTALVLQLVQCTVYIPDSFEKKEGEAEDLVGYCVENMVDVGICFLYPTYVPSQASLCSNKNGYILFV